LVSHAFSNEIDEKLVGLFECSVVFSNDSCIKGVVFGLVSRGAPAEFPKVLVDCLDNGCSYSDAFIVLSGEELAHVEGVFEWIDNSPPFSHAVEIDKGMMRSYGFKIIGGEATLLGGEGFVNNVSEGLFIEGIEWIDGNLRGKSNVGSTAVTEEFFKKSCGGGVVVGFGACDLNTMPRSQTGEDVKGNRHSSCHAGGNFFSSDFFLPSGF